MPTGQHRLKKNGNSVGIFSQSRISQQIDQNQILMVHSWSSLGLLLHYLCLPLVYLHQARVKKTWGTEWDRCVVVGPAWSLETAVWHQIQNKILDREDLSLTPRHWPELLELLPNDTKSKAESVYFPPSRWSASNSTTSEAAMAANLSRHVEYFVFTCRWRKR